MLDYVERLVLADNEQTRQTNVFLVWHSISIIFYVLITLLDAHADVMPVQVTRQDAKLFLHV